MTPNPKHARQQLTNSEAEQAEAEADGTATAVMDSEEKSLLSYIPHYLRQHVRPHHGDFCCTPCFHPTLVAQLMMEGFLPIATTDFVLPKLHNQRCVIQPLSATLHVARSVRQKAKRYSITINQKFDEVVAACRQQHGDHCWLYPKLVQAFGTIHDQTTTSTTGYYRTTTVHGQMVPVRLYSIEVWNVETGALAAGELGYAVGTMFTSLTGFCAESSAGSVQLAALGRLLVHCNFTVWDLGMDMGYKAALGSRLVPRDAFVRTVHACRLQPNIVLQLPTEAEVAVGATTGQGINCRDIIDIDLPAAATTTATVPVVGPSASAPKQQPPGMKTQRPCKKTRPSP